MYKKTKNTDRPIIVKKNWKHGLKREIVSEKNFVIVNSLNGMAVSKNISQ